MTHLSAKRVTHPNEITLYVKLVSVRFIDIYKGTKILDLKPQHTRRWYDNQPAIKDLSETLSGMPDELKTLMGDALLWYMVRESKVNTKGKPYTSVGSVKIIGLHQSKKKRRQYDQNQKLHEAMSAFYLLSPPDQDAITSAMWELVGCVQSYYATCFLAKEASNLELVRTITKTYASKGSSEAQLIVQQVVQKFQEDPQSSPVKQSNATDNPESSNEVETETGEESSPPSSDFKKPQDKPKNSSFGSRFRR